MGINEVRGYHDSMHNDDGTSGFALAARDTLDRAVRCLAVSPEPLVARTQAAVAVISSKLSPRAFEESEARELLQRILASGAPACAARHETRTGSVHQISDAAAQRIASDILDLRDTLMGRAIGSARVRHGKPRCLRPRRKTRVRRRPSPPSPSRGGA